MFLRSAMKPLAQRHARVQRPTSLLEWNRWFAWYPVPVVVDGKLHYAWLQSVERKWGTSRYSGTIKWRYRVRTRSRPSRYPVSCTPRRNTVSALSGLSLTLSPYFLSAFVTRFPNALSERPISRFFSFKVLDLAPPFFFRTVVFIAISSSARSGDIVIAHLRPALQCVFLLISYPF